MGVQKLIKLETSFISDQKSFKTRNKYHLRVFKNVFMCYLKF